MATARGMQAKPAQGLTAMRRKQVLSHSLVLVLAGMTLGQLLLGLAILPVSRASRPMMLALAVFLVALAVMEGEVVLAELAPAAAAWWAMAGLVAATILPPALYFYFRFAISEPGATYAPSILLHSLPVMFASGVSALVLALPPLDQSVLIDGANGTVSGPAALAAVGLLLVLVGWLLQLAFYGVTVFRMMVRHRRVLKDRFTDLTGRTLAWFDLVMAIIVIAALQSVVSLFLPPENNPHLQWFDAPVSLALTTTLVLFAVLQKPALQEDGGAPTSRGKGGSRYLKSALTSDDAAEIAVALERAMEQDRLYTDPNLSRTRLAKAVATNPDYLTQTLNEVIGLAFFDYINRWRVREACRLLGDGDASVTDIAFDVGYNSRSAFYRAFRDITGTTPSDFRAARTAEMRLAVPIETMPGLHKKSDYSVNI